MIKHSLPPSLPVYQLTESVNTEITAQSFSVCPVHFLQGGRHTNTLSSAHLRTGQDSGGQGFLSPPLRKLSAKYAEI